MWFKALFIALFLVIIGNSPIYAALPLKYLKANVKPHTGNENVLANYDQMKLKLHLSTGLKDSVNSSFYNSHRKTSITSEIGKAIIILGEVVFIGGFGTAIYSKANNNDMGAYVVFIGTLMIGSAITGLGNLLVHIGNYFGVSGKSRYSLVSPKPNEVGISYTFK